WGHVQNDNITQAGKGRRAQRFVTAISMELVIHPVVIADRNNSEKRERAQVIDDLRKVNPDARFVALHFTHDPENLENVRAITRERVLTRGDNHQTIRTGTMDHEKI